MNKELEKSRRQQFEERLKEINDPDTHPIRVKYLKELQMNDARKLGDPDRSDELFQQFLFEEREDKMKEMQLMLDCPNIKEIKMKQSPGAIKLAVKAYIRGIKEAQKTVTILNKELSKLRSKCDHDHSIEAVRMWAPGHFTEGKECSICGHFEADKPDFVTITTSTMPDDGGYVEVFPK